jgi:hypothetical protein
LQFVVKSSLLSAEFADVILELCVNTLESDVVVEDEDLLQLAVQVLHALLTLHANVMFSSSNSVSFSDVVDILLGWRLQNPSNTLATFEKLIEGRSN